MGGHGLNVLLMTPPRFARRFLSANELTKIGGNVPPLVLPVLAATLPAHHRVRILDGNIETPNMKAFRAMIEDADVIGINCTSGALALNAEICVRVIRALRPDVPIVVGGHHATAQYREWLQRGATVAVLHEGERTFPELIRCLEEGTELANVAGIAFLEGGEIVETEPRQLLENLDESPIPRWDLFDLDRYRIFYAPRARTAVVEESRGCTGTCSFCMATRMWHYRQRYKSIPRILDELRLLRGLGVESIEFAGDGLGNPPEFYRELFRQMVKRDLRFHWGSFMRTDAILEQPDLAEWAARSGCVTLFVGYESPDPGLIDSWGKRNRVPTPVAAYDEVYARLDAAGIHVVGFYISGHPDEPVESVEARLEQHSRWCDIVLLNELRVIKGTADYKRYRRDELLAKDTFYHDPRIPSLSLGRESADRARSIFNRWILTRYPARMLSRKKATRRFFRHMYGFLLRDAMRATPDSLQDFVRLGSTEADPSEMVQQMVGKYLSPRFVGGLLAQAGVPAGQRASLLQSGYA